MRKIVLGLILFLSTSIQAQTYSSIIKDKEIFNFLNGVINASYHGHSLSVNNQIMGPMDTTGLSDPAIKEIFSKTDSGFLMRQIKGIKKDTWGHPFGRNKLIMKVPFGVNPSSMIYSFSVPLFSPDKNKAIVIEAFYCGMVCGGGAYYIYQLQTNGKWKRVKKFKEWAE